MKRLILDYLKRNKWSVFFFGLFFLSLNWDLYLLRWNTGGKFRLLMRNGEFLGAILFGSTITVRDRSLGIERILRTLPLSARRVGIAEWLEFVALVPVVAAILIAVTLLVNFAFGEASAAELALIPLTLAWGVSISGTRSLCQMRGRLTFIPLYVGLVALAVFYGPPIRAPWAGLDVAQVVALSLGLTLAGLSFFAASRSLDVFVGFRPRSLSVARPKARSAEMALPSRKVGMARPWLIVLGASWLLLALLAALGLFGGVTRGSGFLSRVLAFFAERPFEVRYGISASLILIPFAAIQYASMVPLRAFRSLPLSTSKLALGLMSFPLVACLPVFVVALFPVIVFQAEGTLPMTMLLLTGAGCALLCYAVAFRLSIPPWVFLSLTYGFFGFPASLLMTGSYKVGELRVNTAPVIASLLLATIILMGSAFVLFRQGIASTSKPYRPKPMIAGTMPGGR